MSTPSHRQDAPQDDALHPQTRHSAPMRRAILRAAVGLGLFAMLTAGIVAGTRALTAERIADNRQASQHSQLVEVLPEELADVDIQRLVDAACHELCPIGRERSVCDGTVVTGHQSKQRQRIDASLIGRIHENSPAINGQSNSQRWRRRYVFFCRVGSRRRWFR